MLEDFLGQKVVIDFKSEYVAFGTLKRVGDHFLELKGADLHDLRDSDTTREIYVAECARTGIKRNRKTVLINKNEIVAIAKLDEVVEQ
ncbi:hypothetical protein BH11PLA2_BH11PLA2_01960 [soil metagenome]